MAAFFPSNSLFPTCFFLSSNVRSFVYCYKMSSINITQFAIPFPLAYCLYVSPCYTISSQVARPENQLQEVLDNLMKNSFQLKLLAPLMTVEALIGMIHDWIQLMTSSRVCFTGVCWNASANDCVTRKVLINCSVHSQFAVRGLIHAPQLRRRWTQTDKADMSTAVRQMIYLPLPSKPHHPILKCSACNIQSLLCVSKTKLPRFLNANVDK